MTEPHALDHRGHLRQVVGQRLRQARTAKGFSLSGVATGMGVSISTVSHWERGTRAITIDQFCALCCALGVPPTGLLHPPLDGLGHLPPAGTHPDAPTAPD